MTSAQEAAVALLPRTRLLVLLARLLIFSLAEVSASLESGALLRCVHYLGTQNCAHAYNCTC